MTPELQASCSQDRCPRRSGFSGFFQLNPHQGHACPADLTVDSSERLVPFQTCCTSTLECRQRVLQQQTDRKPQQDHHRPVLLTCPSLITQHCMGPELNFVANTVLS